MSLSDLVSSLARLLNPSNDALKPIGTSVEGLVRFLGSNPIANALRRISRSVSGMRDGETTGSLFRDVVGGADIETIVRDVKNIVPYGLQMLIGFVDFTDGEVWPTVDLVVSPSGDVLSYSVTSGVEPGDILHSPINPSGEIGEVQLWVEKMLQRLGHDTQDATTSLISRYLTKAILGGISGSATTALVPL